MPDSGVSGISGVGGGGLQATFMASWSPSVCFAFCIIIIQINTIIILLCDILVGAKLPGCMQHLRAPSWHAHMHVKKEWCASASAAGPMDNGRPRERLVL